MPQPAHGERRLTVTLCCLEFSVSHRASTVGSDCLAEGSSSTSSPRLSGLPSGRGACRAGQSPHSPAGASARLALRGCSAERQRRLQRSHLQERVDVSNRRNVVWDERLQFVLNLDRFGSVPGKKTRDRPRVTARCPEKRPTASGTKEG